MNFALYEEKQYTYHIKFKLFLSSKPFLSSTLISLKKI